MLLRPLTVKFLLPGFNPVICVQKYYLRLAAFDEMMFYAPDENYVNKADIIRQRVSKCAV
jgi:hypothetical protein